MIWWLKLFLLIVATVGAVLTGLDFVRDVLYSRRQNDKRDDRDSGC